MTRLQLTVALSFVYVFTAYAQDVKRTYQDTQNTNTTVVVKQDKADDYDILENQFDLEEYGIGQVIMIKTEKGPIACCRTGKAG